MALDSDIGLMVAMARAEVKNVAYITRFKKLILFIGVS